jgi:hypothetical protein
MKKPSLPENGSGKWPCFPIDDARPEALPSNTTARVPHTPDTTLPHRLPSAHRSLPEHPFNHLPVHIGQAALDSVVIEGEFLVVDT